MTVSNGSRQYEIDSASYTTDVLGDLIRMAVLSIIDCETAELALDGEPEEWRFVVEGRSGYPTISFKIFTGFTSPLTFQSRDNGRQVYSCELTRAEFGTAVEAAARNLWECHGEAGYLEMWQRYAFPQRALSVLTAALTAEGEGALTRHAGS
jgi:hypothetical protein